MIQYFKFVGYERNGSAFQRADKANKKSQMLEYSSSTKTRRSAVRKYAFSQPCLTYTTHRYHSHLPQGASQKIVIYSKNWRKMLIEFNINYAVSWVLVSARKCD